MKLTIFQVNEGILLFILLHRFSAAMQLTVGLGGVDVRWEACGAHPCKPFYLRCKRFSDGNMTYLDVFGYLEKIEDMLYL